MRRRRSSPCVVEVRLPAKVIRYQTRPAPTLVEARKLRAERSAHHGQSIVGIGGSVSPCERTTRNTKDRLKTVGEVIENYRDSEAGWPDRARQPLTGKAPDRDTSRLRTFHEKRSVTATRLRRPLAMKARSGALLLHRELSIRGAGLAITLRGD